MNRDDLTKEPAAPLQKDDATYKKELTDIQYQVTRHAATERPFTGEYWGSHGTAASTTACAAARRCSKSDTKFDAGCGWPSYFKPINGEVIKEKTDRAHGMLRIEVQCNNCGAHSGPRFRRRPGANRPALLHQLGCATIRTQVSTRAAYSGKPPFFWPLSTLFQWLLTNGHPKNARVVSCRLRIRFDPGHARRTCASNSMPLPVPTT